MVALLRLPVEKKDTIFDAAQINFRPLLFCDCFPKKRRRGEVGVKNCRIRRHSLWTAPQLRTMAGTSFYCWSILFSMCITTAIASQCLRIEKKHNIPTSAMSSIYLVFTYNICMTSFILLTLASSMAAASVKWDDIHFGRAIYYLTVVIIFNGKSKKS